MYKYEYVLNREAVSKEKAIYELAKTDRFSDYEEITEGIGANVANYKKAKDFVNTLQRQCYNKLRKGYGGQSTHHIWLEDKVTYTFFVREKRG